MLYIAVLSVALCAAQVISFPAPGRDTEDNTKVMKCIVEVISDTLSKPKPVPTSEDCLETLRGDERIISILRHQNLLKELQELAAQGAMERIQKQKKNGAGFAEELSGILEKQNKPLPSDKSQAPVRDEEEEEEKKSSEREEERRRSSEREEERRSSEREEEERRRSSEREESNEELESNEISKREETSEDEEIDNRITDEINDMELPKDNREEEAEPASRKDQEGEEPASKKDPEGEEPDKEDHKQDSNETDNEEDDTQREDNSMRIPEDFNKDSASESDNSKEGKQDADTIDCAEEEARSGSDASKDLEDSKRWNKMDELAKELRAKKCAARSSEDAADRSMKIPPKEPSDLNSQEDRQQPPQPSREDSAETEAPILKRAEEKKEEEGSAIRKTEDQELESLAAIEAELENVAHKLHDLRRG